MSYLLEVTACWAVFYGIYHLLLRAETFHRTNRWYLLTTLLLGLLIPSLDIGIWATKESPAYLLQPITVGARQLEAIVVTASQQEQGIDFQAVAFWIYWLGVAVALAHFGFGLWQIGRLYRAGEVAQLNGYDFVNTDAPHLPFSFFRNLFWSKNFETTEEERRSIVRHEEAHIFQRHSHDVVLLELVAALTWCIPFVHFYRKAVKTTHEYLADAHVTAGFDKKQYGRLLLRQSHPGMQVAISNSLFSSQLKKRIVMMTKTNSPQRAALKYLAVLPALAVLLMAFSLENGPLPTPSELLENQPVENIDGPDSPPSAMAVGDTVPVENRLHYVAEMAAQFPGDEGIPNAEGGYDYPNKNLTKFIFDNMRYPAEAREQGIEGMVFAKFVIEKDGSISDIDIKEGALGGGCEEEVKRIISLMPKWKPGTTGGKPVRSIHFLPIKFKLDDKPVTAQAVKPLTINELDEVPVMACCEGFEGEKRQNCSTSSLMSELFSRISYPVEAKEKGIEGTVYVKFTIEEDGSMTNPEIVKSIGGGCDEEVLRVVQELRWSPGRKDGKAVSTSFVLPVMFKLDEMGKKAEFFEVYPNPAGDSGFNVKFKAPAGRVSILIRDATGKGDAGEKPFANYDGSEQTVHFSTRGWFANGTSSGSLVVYLLGEMGHVLASTTVIIQ